MHKTANAFAAVSGLSGEKKEIAARQPSPRVIVDMPPVLPRKPTVTVQTLSADMFGPDLHESNAIRDVAALPREVAILLLRPDRSGARGSASTPFSCLLCRSLGRVG